MGGLKNNWFWNRSRPFVWLGHVVSGGAGAQKRHLWRAADSGYSQAACHFNDGVCWAFGFPRGCPPINSVLCLLFAFSYCIRLRVFCCYFFFLLCFPLFLWEKILKVLLCRWFCITTAIFLPQSFIWYVHLCFCRSFCCAGWSIGLGFWFVWVLFG